MHGREELPLGPESLPMSDALIVMTRKSYGCFGVVDAGGKLTGIVTDGDLRRNMTPDLLNRSVGSVMTRAPKTVGPDALASEALEQLNSLKITSLFVIDEAQQPVGLVHIHDLLRIGLI